METALTALMLFSMLLKVGEVKELDTWILSDKRFR